MLTIFRHQPPPHSFQALPRATESNQKIVIVKNLSINRIAKKWLMSTVPVFVWHGSAQITPPLLPRAVIDTACIDESIKKNLSIIDIEKGTRYRFICKLGKYIIF